MKNLTTQFALLRVENVKNRSSRKSTSHMYALTLIMFLLPFSACSLFYGSWDDGIKLGDKGEALLAEKKYDESIKAFSKAISIIENVGDRGQIAHGQALSNIYRLRGNAYFSLKDYDKSLADFNKSIELNNKGYGTAYVERGNLFLLKKDYEKAAADFEKAYTYPPYYQDDYRAALGLAIACYETQNYEKADHFLSSAFSDLQRSKEYAHYDPEDHIKAYEYSIKLFEQRGDTKNAELDKQSLEKLKKKHNKN